MALIKLRHFKKAIEDISYRGDNDTMPFDFDNKFISDNKDNLASLAYEYFVKLEGLGKAEARV
ncbi:MAG: hypothetical protein COB24_12060 [Hyphomicrobiales bacterium]|nr:MAG: hypothetical protein COB24_12060 [Hyphomicrobiales bacterium]